MAHIDSGEAGKIKNNGKEKKVIPTHYLFNSNEKTGKQLFFGSVIHLPVLLALLMIHKKWNLPGYSHHTAEEEELDELIEWVIEES